MKSSIKKTILKALAIMACILGFGLITLICFSPILDGKRIKQHDIEMFKGMSKEIADYKEATGEQTLWTNSMFGGMPAWNISVSNSSNLMMPVSRILTVGFPHPIGAVFISMLGFFILLLVLDCNIGVSFLGGIAYGLSSYLFIVIGAGHNSKAMAMAYMAPVIAGILLTYKGKYLWGSVLTAIALALEVRAGHLQITYYLLLTIVILIVAELVSDLINKKIGHFFKASGCLILAAVLGILTNTTTLYANYVYSKDTTRGKPVLTQNTDNQTTGLERDYITQWSYGKGETWSLMIPNVKGGASAQIGSRNPALKKADRQFRDAIAQQNAYWGDQPFTSGPVYVGAIVVFLFVLGALTAKGKVKWALVAATLLSILLSWGKNFMGFTDFFIDFIPGYSKFRAVSMTLVIAEVCMPLLGFMGLAEILKNPDQYKKNLIKFLIALGFTVGWCLVFYTAPDLLFSFLSQSEAVEFAKLFNGPDGTIYQTFVAQLEEVRMSIFRSDVLRSLLFNIAAAIPVLLMILLPVFRGKKKKENPSQKIIPAIALGFLAILVFADLFSVDNRYLNSSSYTSKKLADKPFVASNADQYILNDQSPDFRVLNLGTNVFNDASTSYFHKSIGGYHGAKLRRYQDLINSPIIRGTDTIYGYLNPEIQQLRQVQTPAAFMQAMERQQTLNMLNTKYIIFNPETALENPYAFGNAWIVNDVRWVGTPNEEFEALGTTDLRQTAVLHKEFQNQVGDYSFADSIPGQIVLTEYKPNKLTYSFNAEKDQLVVFSEIWSDTGWKLYLDGKEHPLLRADYLLRSAMIPSGEHQIVMEYAPSIWKTGNAIQLASSSLLILGLIAAIVFSILSAFVPKFKKEESKA